MDCGAQVISHLSLDLVGPGFAVVRGYAAGESVRVLIDTGDFAPYAVLITPHLAARLKLQPQSPARCIHASLGPGPVCFTPVSLSFRVGGLAAFHDKAAISLQVGQIAARLGRRFEAVIGGEFLKSHRLTIDYEHRVATFDSPAPKGASIGFSALPAPVVVGEASVNGAGPFRFLVDTAAADTIASSKIAERARITAGAPTRLYGAGGNIPGALSTNDRICVGKRCQSQMPVKIAELPQSIDLLGISIDGVLGVGFLAGGKLTIDYPAHRLWLER
jgi:hypothetical protein